MSAEQATPPGAARILLVDDEPQLVRSLARFLRRSGFVVEMAPDGPQALALLDAFAPDLVISDFRMPGMNGARLLAEIRLRRPTALRMLLSGCADFDEIDRALGDDPDCPFVTKPWDSAALLALIRGRLAARPGGSAPEPVKP